ncbi:Uncharacterised protein [Nocardia otitidiscaviarum]|uniref:Uncharacterized protein n=1 Tax=Nocardia otitidiscaviarum TaxID=1823 RepID=A0A379JIQ3_9NOCA|nr:hypothetical protein [Nocardia otitidiscaviarum]SUD48141.1 Uncharacterised protein [Nocardia otitidiscaviarum]
MRAQGNPHPPPWVPVTVVASKPIRLRHGSAPMLVEFAPGLRFDLRPGENRIMLPVGRFRAQLWSRYALWSVGRAVLDIDTTRGPVWLYYAAPRTIYSAGAADFRECERPGAGVYAAIIAAAVLIPLTIVLVAVLQR